MSSVPGSGTPGSSVPGAVGGAVTPPVPSQSSPPSGPPIVKDYYGNVVTDPSKPYVTGVIRVAGLKGGSFNEYPTYSNGNTGIPVVHPEEGSQNPDQGTSQGDTKSQAQVNADIAALGINYKSQTENLVNGNITSGGPSVRDLYVQNAVAQAAEGYKMQGTTSPIDSLSKSLDANGFSFNPQTKTITDPLETNIINEQVANESKGGYAGLSEGGPSTPQSIALGSSYGQAGLGYTPAVSNEGTLNYGPAQIASLISSVKNNPEYGNNPNFLVGDIGTQNSVGSLAALNTEQNRNTDIPNSLANHDKSITLTETVGIGDQGSIGKNPLSNADIALGNGLASLSNQQIVAKNQSIGLGNALIDISNQQIEAKNLSIEEQNQVITQLNNNAEVNFAVDNVLGNLPQSKFSSFENVLGANVVNIISGGEAFLGNTLKGLYALTASLPQRYIDLFSGKQTKSSDFLKTLGTIITPHEETIYNKNAEPSTDELKGITTAFSGGGLEGFSSGQGPVYDVTYEGLTLASLLVGSGITKIPNLVNNAIAKSLIGRAIGAEAKSAAIIYSSKGSNMFEQGVAEGEPSLLLRQGQARIQPTFKNLNMMRESLPTDIFESDTALGLRPIGSEAPLIPKNFTLENTASEISKLSQTQNDLLKPSSIEPISNKNIPVSEDVFYNNKVPMKSLGSDNGIGTNVRTVDTNAILGTGTTPPEDLTGGGGSPITPPPPVIIPPEISPTSASLGNLPGSGVPGSNVAGAIGGELSSGLPDIFQQPLSSRVDFERRIAQKANPDLFESGFVPFSKTFTGEEFRMTLVGKQNEALRAFNVQLNPNEEYILKPLMPKELSKNSKLSKLISNQTVGTRPEIFGTTKEVKLKLTDIEYNPAEHFISVPRSGKSPFDIQFGDIPLFSNQEFTSNLLSPEEQALAERYPLMTNTLKEAKLFSEPRSIPQTGKAPIQSETFNILETVKGREEAKFFRTFELKTDFEEIGYVPKNENGFFIKTIPSGQRLEALDLFKTGIKAKLNPDYYSRIGIPKELMGKFSKELSIQTTGTKLPEIFGEKAEEIGNKSNLDAFYSPSQNIRQFFERLESNHKPSNNNPNYVVNRNEPHLTYNKTKINTDKLLGIDNEEPNIGESKERLDIIEKGAIKRNERENKLIKLPQRSEEVIYQNARTFFENEKSMFSETRINLGVGEGRLIPKGGGLASILKNFGKPSNPPPVKPEEPKTTRSQGGLIQILKEPQETKTIFKEYPIQLGEGTVRLPKKTRRITAGLTGLESATAQALEELQGQKQKQSSSLIFQPLQTFEQAQGLLYKPLQKQKQPQDISQLFEQEQTPALSQLFKPLQEQQQQPKLEQLLEQVPENPFPNEPPQKQLELLQEQPQIFPNPQHEEPPLPPFVFPDDHKKHPKKKKESANRYNFIGNVPEFDIAGVFKRNEIIYGNSAISRLTSQDTSNMNKKYSEKYQTGKEKTLFTSKKNKSIKIKGSSAKPKSLQDKFKKKIKI